MTTSKIVDYDPSAKTYVLPQEHAASLTRAAGAENLAPWLRFVPFAAKVEDQIVDVRQTEGDPIDNFYIARKP